MKTQFPFQIFLSVVLFTLTLIVSAQEKPQALKFDEFDDITENPFYSDRKELTFTERVERFSKQLEKERGDAAVYVIYYQARIINEDFGWRRFVTKIKEIKNKITYNSRIKIKDVVIVDGGYRERNTAEFWIVPKNAAPPVPTPTVDKEQTFVCRNIFIESKISFDEPETIYFYISPDNFRRLDNYYSLNWKVSAGEIVEGQGTDTIRVKNKDLAVKRITAFAELGGLPYPCSKVFSATANFTKKIRLLDDFKNISNEELQARLDQFLTILKNYPAAKGYIIVYGNRAENGRDIVRRISVINEHFAFRDFDISNVTIVRGGFREEVSSEFWLSFDDSEKPTLTPTVDEKFISLPKSTTKTRLRKKSK